MPEVAITVVVLVAMCMVYRIVISAIDSQRAQRLAKIEADLKLKLAEKLGDADRVQQVLHGYGEEGHAQGDWRNKTARAPGAGSDKERPPRMVLGGMTTFLVGLALVIASQADPREFDGTLLPGLICSAVGLSLLTYATSQKDIRRMIEDEPRAGTRSER